MSEQLERALAMQRHLEGLLKQGKTHLMELRNQAERALADRDRAIVELNELRTACQLLTDERGTAVAQREELELALRSASDERERLETALRSTTLNAINSSRTCNRLGLNGISSKWISGDNRTRAAVWRDEGPFET